MISIKARKKLWRDFYDLSSDVNRLIITDFPKEYPLRPMLYWENPAGICSPELRFLQKLLDVTHSVQIVMIRVPSRPCPVKRLVLAVLRARTNITFVAADFIHRS